MTKRTIAIALALAAFGAWSAPASARHPGKHCTLTIHHPLGTDDIPVEGPVDDAPTDLGSVKFYIDCHTGP